MVLNWCNIRYDYCGWYHYKGCEKAMEEEIMEAAFVLLTFTVLSCIFMICWAAGDFILGRRKAKRDRIIKEKGYLPIEMEKR